MPKGRIGRDGETKRLSQRALKASGVVVGAALVVCLVIGAALMRQHPQAVGVDVDPQATTGVVAGSQRAAPTESAEALLADDPLLVAAAVVDLRDDWFYADNDELMLSIDAVFGGATTDGALFLLSGLSAQRAGVLAAEEPNKTFYRSVALSAEVLGESDGDVLVEVWDMEVISQRNLVEPQAQWGRQRLFLRRDGERWLVTSWSALAGPAPALSQLLRPADALEFESDLGGHRRIEDWMGVEDPEGFEQ